MNLFFDLNQELQNLAESLDIPPQIAEQAIATYDDVAEWLSQDDSPLRAGRNAFGPLGTPTV